MASCHRLFVALFIFAAILGVASYAEGEVLFSKLPNTLLVTAALPGGGPFPGSIPSVCFFPPSVLYSLLRA